MSASESFWHLYGYPMQNCYPPVQKLQLHLENYHRILYAEGMEEAALNAEANTTLTNYFFSVRTELVIPLSATILGPHTPAFELLYSDFPTYYTWNGRCWQRRTQSKQSATIGRPLLRIVVL